MLAIEGGRVERCHCFPTITNPTVAQHTFNAVSLLLCLCPDPTINMIKALQFHDVAERFLGDMPATAKWKFPDLKEVYERIEWLILDTNGMYPKLSETERKWVAAMDMLEFFLYIKHEERLGNRYAAQRLHNIEQALITSDLPIPVREFFSRYRFDYDELEDKECGI